jgi:hypothetical protein
MYVYIYQLHTHKHTSAAYTNNNNTGRFTHAYGPKICTRLILNTTVIIIIIIIIVCRRQTWPFVKQWRPRGRMRSRWFTVKYKLADKLLAPRPNFISIYILARRFSVPLPIQTHRSHQGLPSCCPFLCVRPPLSLSLSLTVSTRLDLTRITRTLHVKDGFGGHKTQQLTAVNVQKFQLPNVIAMLYNTIFYIKYVCRSNGETERNIYRSCDFVYLSPEHSGRSPIYPLTRSYQ